MGIRTAHQISSDLLQIWKGVVCYRVNGYTFFSKVFPFVAPFIDGNSGFELYVSQTAVLTKYPELLAELIKDQDDKEMSSEKMPKVFEVSETGSVNEGHI